jgi:hypothetical protein
MREVSCTVQRLSKAFVCRNFVKGTAGIGYLLLYRLRLKKSNTLRESDFSLDIAEPLRGGTVPARVS